MIKQTIPYTDIVSVNKVYLPTNEESINTLINHMIGDVEVSLCNESDDSVIECVQKFGKHDFNVYDMELNNINQNILTLRSADSTYSTFKFYWIPNRKPFDENQFSTFLENGNIFQYHKSTNWFNSALLSCNIEKYKKNSVNNYEYEKIIARKYEEYGFKVIYNRMQNNEIDNSIDLICIKNSDKILVQCKNWNESSKFSIEQKDIRAFMGDCHIHLMEDEKYTNVAYHYIVSHHDLLHHSAKDFLKKNSFIKYQCVKFSHP